MVQSVLVSKERLFRYQRQTYRAVQGLLQEYWCHYKARELTMSQLLGRCAHLTVTALNCAEHLTIDDAVLKVNGRLFFLFCPLLPPFMNTNCGASPPFFIQH